MRGRKRRWEGRSGPDARITQHPQPKGSGGRTPGYRGQIHRSAALGFRQVRQVSSIPVPFKGTLTEASANYATHMFLTTGDPDEGLRCGDCDCRARDSAALYPCGTEVPRREVKVTR